MPKQIRTTSCLIAACFFLIAIGPLSSARASRTETAAEFFARCPNCLVELVAANDELLSRFPIDKYHYVFIGRSPAPFEAELETRGHTEFTRLPISAASWQDLELLRAWLHQRLPHSNSRQLSDRKILMIDFASTGASLTRLQEIAHEFYLNSGKGPVEALALETEYSIHRRYHSKYGRLPYHAIRLGRAFGEEIVDHNLKTFSTTPTHQLSESDSTPTEPVFNDARFNELKFEITRRKLRGAIGAVSCEVLFPTAHEVPFSGAF